jgi:arylsulfatase A-like enzyme
LDKLDELGLMGNTVVAFSADHGEMLGAHGKFDKCPDFYEETVHIPMIVRDPRQAHPKKPDGFVNLRDLFPTLISLAGADSILTEDEQARSCWVTEHEHTFYCYDSYHMI